MNRVKWILPLLAACAACVLTIARAEPLRAAPPDQVATVDSPSVDAVTAPSALPALPAAPDRAQPNTDISMPRVLAIETANPQATVVTAFGLFLPSKPRPILALAGPSDPFLVNPYDDGVPLAVKLWRGGSARRRLNC